MSKAELKTGRIPSSLSPQVSWAVSNGHCIIIIDKVKGIKRLHPPSFRGRYVVLNRSTSRVLGLCDNMSKISIFVVDVLDNIQWW
jgi:hypothetical protein